MVRTSERHCWSHPAELPSAGTKGQHQAMAAPPTLPFHLLLLSEKVSLAKHTLSETPFLCFLGILSLRTLLQPVLIIYWVERL